MFKYFALKPIVVIDYHGKEKKFISMDKHTGINHNYLTMHFYSGNGGAVSMGGTNLWIP